MQQHTTGVGVRVCGEEAGEGGGAGCASPPVIYAEDHRLLQQKAEDHRLLKTVR